MRSPSLPMLFWVIATLPACHWIFPHHGTGSLDAPGARDTDLDLNPRDVPDPAADLRPPEDSWPAMDLVAPGDLAAPEDLGPMAADAASCAATCAFDGVCPAIPTGSVAGWSASGGRWQSSGLAKATDSFRIQLPCASTSVKLVFTLDLLGDCILTFSFLDQNGVSPNEGVQMIGSGSAFFELYAWLKSGSDSLTLTKPAGLVAASITRSTTLSATWASKQVGQLSPVAAVGQVTAVEVALGGAGACVAQIDDLSVSP